MTNEEAKQILTDAFNGIWQVYGYMNSADAPSGQASEARWIPVSEKLPLDGVLVVVKTKDGAKKATIGLKHFEDWALACGITEKRPHRRRRGPRGLPDRRGLGSLPRGCNVQRVKVPPRDPHHDRKHVQTKNYRTAPRRVERPERTKTKIVICVTYTT